jgi:hypothetical protein
MFAGILQVISIVWPGYRPDNRGRIDFDQQNRVASDLIPE